LDGRYYLPYRLHATADQFHRAYPQDEDFFDRKRQYDPDEVFRNRFYDKYKKRGRRRGQSYDSSAPILPWTELSG
ncbi:MAG: hypothetical protein V3S94_06955, partial [Gammaproteobacteria bacterium]